MKKLNFVLLVIIIVSLVSCNSKKTEEDDPAFNPAIAGKANLVEYKKNAKLARKQMRDLISQEQKVGIYIDTAETLNFKDDQDDGRQKKNNQQQQHCDSCNSPTVTINNNIICGNCAGAKHSSPKKKVPVKKDSPSTQPKQSNCKSGTTTLDYEDCKGHILFSEFFEKTGDEEKDSILFIEAKERLQKKVKDYEDSLANHGKKTKLGFDLLSHTRTN